MKCLRCFSDIVLTLERCSFAMSCCSAFKCGTLLRVSNVAGKRYYKAKIIKVNDDQTIKIHYINWSSSCDEVLSVASPRLETWSGDVGEGESEKCSSTQSPDVVQEASGVTRSNLL